MTRNKHCPSATPIAPPHALFVLVAMGKDAYIMHFHRANSCCCLPTYACRIIVNKPSSNPPRPPAILFLFLSPFFFLLSPLLSFSLSPPSSFPLLSFQSLFDSLRFSRSLSFYPFICPPPPHDSRDRDSLLIPRG